MSEAVTGALLADCGAKVGLGHLRRMIMLARALLRKGVGCKLILTDTAVSAFAGDDIAVERWDENVLPHANVVAIDGYGFDPTLSQRWSRQTGAALLVVDDLGDRPISANVILNHNIYGADVDYSAYRADKILAGPKYALIDPSFAGLAGTVRPGPAEILVSFGGTDDGTYAAATAQAILARSPEVVVHLVLSPLATQSTDARKLATKYSGRAIVHHGARLTDLMSKARTYVGAGGVTLMEALAAGLDAVVCAIAPNQMMNIAALTRLGYPAFEGFDPDAMATATLARLRSPSMRKQMLIDGRGADRVADELLAFIATKSQSHSVAAD